MRLAPTQEVEHSAFGIVMGEARPAYCRSDNLNSCGTALDEFDFYLEATSQVRFPVAKCCIFVGTSRTETLDGKVRKSHLATVDIPLPVPDGP